MPNLLALSPLFEVHQCPPILPILRTPEVGLHAFVYPVSVAFTFRPFLPVPLDGMEFAHMCTFVPLLSHPNLIVTERDLEYISGFCNGTRVVTLSAFAQTQVAGWTGTRGQTAAVRIIVQCIVNRFQQHGHFYPTHPLDNNVQVEALPAPPFEVFAFYD